MKEFVIISGKGGTGKTSITASIAAMANNAVFADCDVDAADLQLILKPDIREKGDFKAGQTAVIDGDICTGCGECMRECRFHAIIEKGPLYMVDHVSCEGCKVCKMVCPVNAIAMRENTCGSWFVSDTRFGPMVHAELRPGSENSGKLVSFVRKKAKEIAHAQRSDLIIVDGPPGIGCPVIASIVGAHLVLIVTEPTQSGVHDLKRVSELADHFKVPACVCINKYDLNLDVVREIEEFCARNNMEVVGKVPYDLEFTKAMLDGLSIVEYSSGETSREINRLWKLIK